MALSNALQDLTLPTDSVLRRHALTERNRVLGLPPTDSVLRRHHAQWQASLRGESLPPRMVSSGYGASASVLQGAGVAAAQPVPMAPASSPAASVAQEAQGGVLGWLKRMLGWNS